ncbi:MAG: hypothetical protein IT317_20410 [Anaerolineales bacterium]|nr:hypothetical protein [Anaerolineales bacterium]
MFTTVQQWVGRVAQPFSPARHTPLTHERLRFNTLGLIALFKLFLFLGAAWDIQWHVVIGRDNLFIPPHIVAGLAYVGGLALSLSAIVYETWLDRQGKRLSGVIRLGGIATSPTFLAVALSYMAGTVATGLDDQWHRLYGLDATLWSPPHLLIMVAMSGIDFSLLLGFTAAARRLGWGLDWRKPACWGILLAAAYTFEAANFQISQAFIEGFGRGGAGLWGLLFPLMMGAWYPLTLTAQVRATGRFWVALPVALLCLGLQYLATGTAALGFAILQPVSVMDEFVRQNPTAVISLAREFGRLNGFNDLIGLQQAWIMWLSVIPLGLVALLDLRPALRARPWLAAPVYSLSLMLVCYLVLQRLPHFWPAGGVTGAHLLLGMALATAGGLVTAWLGQKLGSLADRM